MEVSKLFDRFRNAARSRLGDAGSAVPNAQLSHALRRASDERAALRAASPAGDATLIIDVENVETAILDADNVEAAVIDVDTTAEVPRIEAEVKAQERLAAAAARERADAEELALQAAQLRVEVEERAAELAKEREEAERSAAHEAQPIYRRNPSPPRERDEHRTLKRYLVLALVALVIVVGTIIARAFMPELFGEHATAPVFQLDHELKTPPGKSGK